MVTAEATCRKGGVIIMCAACNDGHGGEEFYQWFAKAKSAQAVMDKIMAIEELSIRCLINGRPNPGSHLVIDYTVIMVTDQCDHEMIKNMKMKVTKTFPEALKMAEEIAGKDARITVVPDGVSVIVK